jgi:hypothetical protein
LEARLGPDARVFEPILVIRHHRHRYHQDLPMLSPDSRSMQGENEHVRVAPTRRGHPKTW